MIGAVRMNPNPDAFYGISRMKNPSEALAGLGRGWEALDPVAAS
jgi:hypothetical protein